jgi:hypothetical protein
MNQRKSKAKTKKLVWRISESSPKGEWVDVNAPIARPSRNDLPEVSSGGWVGSSFDLLSGADVSDDPDTVPNALLDELFQTPPKSPEE